MARHHAEESRRRALVNAAAEMIGECGSLDVTVKAIAQRAGMSSALAFHYFGDKDEIVTATMRHLLKELGQDVAKRLAGASTPAERLDAIVRASFAPDQFDRKTIAAWLVFYLKALSAEGPARLLAIYHQRLRNNLLFALKQIVTEQRAATIADGLAAMIDGLYIRHGLGKDGPKAEQAINLCLDYLDNQLKAAIGPVSESAGGHP